MSIMLLNDTPFKVLELFTRDYSVSIHGWEASKRLNLNQKSVANTLLRLEEKMILTSSRKGRNRPYRLNIKNPSLHYILTMVETEKAIRFRDGSGLPLEYIKMILGCGSPLVIVFGSYATFSNDSQSDLDLVVVKPFEMDLEAIERIYKIRPSIKSYSIKEFKKALELGDFLMREVVNNHVVLLGAELFVRMNMEASNGQG